MIKTMNKFEQSDKSKDEKADKEIKEHSRKVEKYKKMSTLEMTARDHKIIGSTPPSEMIAEPDKTLAELMTDEEILAYLREEKEGLEDFSKDKYKKNSFVKSSLPGLKRDLKLSIEYLRKIGRLPKEFEDFEVED